MYSKQDITEMIKNSHTGLTLVKPKNSTSTKWNNYHQVVVDNVPQHFISCKSCQTVLAWKAADGTNVMEKHDKACQTRKSTSSNVQQSITSFYSTINDNNKHLICGIKKKIAKTMALCCALDDLPFSSVQGNGLRLLAQDLIKAGRQIGSNVSVNEILSDPSTISRQIDRIYAINKEKLKSFLSTIDHYAITIDFWTEEYTKVGFGGVTLHTYTSSHGLLVFVLACEPYNLPDQTAANIRLFTNAILESYDLKLNKLKYVVSDNENKMRASFREGTIRVGCSAHFLNKIIEHALCKPDIDCDDIQQMFNDVHDIITYVRRSHNQSKLSKRLQLFCRTRWNSAYYMISSFIDVYAELNTIITEKNYREKLARIDLNDLKAFAKYFKYFVDVTELLSAEKHSTISLVVPLKQRLIKLSEEDESDPQSIKNLKKYIQKKLLLYWEVDDVHLMAAVLHPKFKHLNICSNDEYKIKAYNLIRQEIEKRCLQQSTTSSQSADLLSSSTKRTQSSHDNNNILSSCYDQVIEPRPKVKPNEEFDRYLQSTDSLLHENEDLYAYWEREKESFPILYKIACEILMVPATNTAAERLFSSSGNVVTETRTRLAAQKINKLLFIKKNYFFLQNFSRDNQANIIVNDKTNILNNVTSSPVPSKRIKRAYEQISKDDNNIELTITSSDDDAPDGPLFNEQSI